MTNADRVVTRNKLSDQVWGTDWLGGTRMLDVHMSGLRSNILCNETVRGVG